MSAAATTPGPTIAAPSADRPVTIRSSIAVLGIVYGDLGTSPLYTYQTIVGSVGGHPSVSDALGFTIPCHLGADRHGLDKVLRLRHAG
jgi:hypothetical protein